MSLGLRSAHLSLTEHEAERLANPRFTGYTVQVKPPNKTTLPASLNEFVRGVMEFQTKRLGTKNVSPLSGFEIRRSPPNRLRFQYAVPTKRLVRKVRTHLQNQIPEVSFDDGVTGLPVAEGSEVGGGMLTVGRRDWYPLQTDFDEPPTNAIAAALHRHAMRDTQVVIQVLFKPVIGRPLRNWYRTKRTYQRVGFLRKEKEKLWGSRSPTPREKQQADAIERKAGTPRFLVSIRVFVTGAGEYTPSRIKELAGAFNLFENPDTGQYLNTVTVRSLRRGPRVRFYKAIADRQFRGWTRGFQASIPELAGLLALPARHQQNIDHSHP